jgi:acetyl-CoA C-acetyltransferase
MIWRRFRCGRWWSATRASSSARPNDVLMGCGFPEGEQGYNIGRNAVLLAGIDHHVPAVTVSRFCASSLQTIRMAFHAIKAGEGDQYIAAGVECVSRGAARRSR